MQSIYDLLGKLASPLQAIVFILGGISSTYVGVRILRSYTSRPKKRRMFLGGTFDKILETKTAVGEDLTLKNFREIPNLFMATPLTCISHNEPDVLTSASELVSLLDEQKFVAVLGDAGEGKSTLSRLLYCDLVDRYKDGVFRYFPVLIQKSGVILNTGGEPNPNQPIGRLYTQLKTELEGASPKMEDTLFIFESLDEMSAFCSEKWNVNDDMNSIQRAIVFCRNSFYEANIKHGESRSAYRVYVIKQRTKDVLNKGLDALLKIEKIKPEPSSVVNIRELIEQGVVKSPLHVAMAAALARRSRSEISIHSAPELYHQFANMICSREIDKINTEVTSSELMKVLRLTVASLHISDMRNVMSYQRPFSIDYIMRCIENAGLVRQDSHQLFKIITSRAILIKGTSDLDADTKYEFDHASFADFFLAEAIWNYLISDQEQAVKLLKYLLPQEVYEFLKVRFLQVQDPLLATQVRQGAESVLGIVGGLNVHDANLLKGRSSADENVIEQTLHLLGHMNFDGTRKFVSQYLGIAASHFVHRGIRIGLAFGGDAKPLSEYVGELKRELTTDDTFHKNAANLAHQSIYFGSPEVKKDALVRRFEPSMVRQIVDKLLIQLQSSNHYGSRELDLYTLWFILGGLETDETECCEWRKMAMAMAGAQNKDSLVGNLDWQCFKVDDEKSKGGGYGFE